MPSRRYWKRFRVRSETKREAFFAVVWNDGTYWLYPSGESGNLGFTVHPGPYNVEQFALYARNDGVGCVRNVNDNTFYEVDFKTGTVGNVVRTGSGLRVVWNGEEWLFERFRTGPCVSGTRGYWEDAAGQALGFSVNADRDYFRGMAVSEDRARAWVQRTFSGSDTCCTKRASPRLPAINLYPGCRFWARGRLRGWMVRCMELR